MTHGLGALLDEGPPAHPGAVVVGPLPHHDPAGLDVHLQPSAQRR